MMSRQAWGVVFVGVVVSLAGSQAAAQDDAPFGAADQLAFSAERLFGLEHATQTVSITGGTATTTSSGVSVFSNPLASLTTYATPRVAVDRLVTKGVSLGAALGFFTISRSGTISAQETGVTVGPRAGYALTLGQRASLWPRLGLAYGYVRSSGAGIGGLTNSRTQWAMVVDAPLVITLAPHFFVSVAPTVDVGFGGKVRTTSNMPNGPSGSQDVNETDFAFQCALGGYL
jgi:hypothetical protein